MRWEDGAASGVVVAGGNGPGAALNQLGVLSELGIAFDAAGRLHITDGANHRVMRWAEGAGAGVVVAGGNGPGAALNQLHKPCGIAFDLQ
eukprot:gene4127-222_t